MNPPFTIEQFLGVFVAYNKEIWPVQVVAYLLGVLAVAAVWLVRPVATRLILASLALMWAWNAIGYHFLYFSTINPAAKLFAALFVLQAILFAAAILVANDIRFEVGHDCRSLAGLTFVVYAMLIYRNCSPLCGSLTRVDGIECGLRG